MIVYKLFRLKKNGAITSLYINKTKELQRNIWLEAESYPTKGYKHRPYWHCTETTNVPHLSIKGRIWLRVEIQDYTEIQRPSFQGGKWYLANKIKIL